MYDPLLYGADISPGEVQSKAEMAEAKVSGMLRFCFFGAYVATSSCKRKDNRITKNTIQ